MSLSAEERDNRAGQARLKAIRKAKRVAPEMVDTLLDIARDAKTETKDRKAAVDSILKIAGTMNDERSSAPVFNINLGSIVQALKAMRDVTPARPEVESGAVNEDGGNG